MWHSRFTDLLYIRSCDDHMLTLMMDNNTLREGKQQDRTWVKDQHHVLLVRVKKSQLNTLQWHNPGPYVQVRGLKPKERIKRLSSVETSELI